MAEAPVHAAAPSAATADATRAGRREPGRWGVLLFLLPALAGVVLSTQLLGRHGEALEKDRLRAIVATAAAALNPQLIAQLQGRPVDVGNPAFEQVRRSLSLVRGAHARARFVYLMGVRDGQVIFLADAEPAASADYSAPGDVYDGLTLGVLQVLAGATPLIEDPYRDAWGEWVSALAPISDPRDGRVLAVLGMDLDASPWRAAVMRYRLFAAVVSGLVVTLFAVFLRALQVQRRQRRRSAALNAELERELVERHRVEEELQLAGAVFDNTAEGIMVTTPEGVIQSVNPAFERITGYPASEALGQTPQLLRSSVHDATFFSEMQGILETAGHWQGEIWNRRKNGERYPQDTSISALRDGSGRIVSYATVLSDITAKKKLERSLRELSVTDGLTGLRNRRRFDEVLQSEWLRMQRNGQPLSLLMGDLDRFKAYNDRYGHLAGDDCLRRIAAVIQATLKRPADLAARYGGEEFAMILPQTTQSRALIVAEQIRRAVEGLQIAHERSEVSRYVTLSLGIAALVPSPLASPANLITLADRALYAAKDGGRNTIRAAASDAVATPAAAP